MLREQRELEKELKGVIEELDTAEQARKIEAESEKKNPDGEIDEELIELIEKWKGASRLAAEELFGKVRDRVNRYALHAGLQVWTMLTRFRMGGPRAWKEMQKKQAENQNSWDQEEPANNNDSDDENGQSQDVEKRDVYAEYGIDPETENEKSQRVRGLGDTGELPGQEDVSFFCLLMLGLY